jgi:hypothetical protein
MSEERRKDYKPIAVGSLDTYPDMISGRIGILADVLSSILQMLIAKELKFLLMTGTKFRYRSALLHGCCLEMKLTEDDISPTGLFSVRRISATRRVHSIRRGPSRLCSRYATAREPIAKRCAIALKPSGP